MNSFSHVIGVRIRYRYRTQSPGIHSFIHLFIQYVCLSIIFIQFSTVTQSCLTHWDPMDCSQASLSITNSWSLLKFMSIVSWCHPTISSSIAPFSSCLQSFPALRYFPVSQFFASDGQSIKVSALASVLPMNIQDWYPLGLTGFISLQSKGLSRVFSNTTVQKHQFFCTQLSSQSNSHIHTWPLEKP